MVTQVPPVDRLGRPQRSLRVSVTDRCNLRCAYCMPEADYVWLPKSDILSFDETVRLVERFVENGVDRLRITGGEPLLRQDLPVLVRMLAERDGVRDVALTTNGILLPRLGAPLRAAGLRRVTISLDTLRRERFRALTGRDDLERTLAGIEHALALGFESVKVNSVVLRGTNDDEIADLLAFAGRRGIELRFIEYMDVGGATRWEHSRVVPRAEILARITELFGPAVPVAKTDAAPADRFVLESGQTFGVISSTTAPFCASCDRSRVTADGMWFTCLYARRGVNLRDALRAGASDEELRALIARVWSGRTDRGAEERLATAQRAAYAPSTDLRRDPHLEMHTRGG